MLEDEKMIAAIKGAVETAVKAAVKPAIDAAIDEKTNDFYVDRERHYREHTFVKELMDWADKTKGTIWGTAVKALVLGVISMFIIGFVVFIWIKGGGLIKP